MKVVLAVAGVGASIGAFVGYLIGDYINYLQAEKSFSETWEELEEKELVKTPTVEKPTLLKATPSQKDYTKYNRLAPPEKESLNSLISKYKSEVEEDLIPDSLPKPRLMSENEWNEIISHERPELVDRQLVFYYSGDDIFALTDGTIVDRDHFVEDIDSAFGQKSTDKDVAYIFNPEYYTYYEVLRLNTSYAVEVLRMAKTTVDAFPKPETQKKEPAVKRSRRATKKVIEKELDEEEYGDSEPE